MTVPDWHAHAEQVAPPALSLLPPLTDLVVSDAPDAPRGTDLPDSARTALGAQVAEELAVLTRVLLGLGHAPVQPVQPVEPVEVIHPVQLVEPAAPTAVPVVAVVPVVPVVPSYDVALLADEAPVFVAPPVVEVVPLVAEVLEVAAVVEPAELDPAPAPRRGAILDELAFLDG